MNGLGNEILVVDARADVVVAAALTPDAVRAIAASPRTAFDQLMLMLPPRTPGTDAFVRIFNADGSMSGACGNGTRCIAALVMAETGTGHATFETAGGLLPAWDAGGGLIGVDMGAPRLAWNEIPLAEPFHDTSAIELQVGPIDAPILHSPAVVNMGNPHAVFFVDDAEAIDLARIGPMLENHPIFPERANISLAQVTAPDAITLRVWERGAGLTRACGSAACATVVAAVRRRLTGRSVTVTLPGGPLLIEWRERDGHVLMTGSFEHEHDGEIALDATLTAAQPAA
ncbi:diaminopimelate epimerase [Tepidamorphus gemmatus]|uniref:Diaminopimelate epimerase n=2 Tax=Tepidamorphus gemmatus TaxID=747076 RepID=A0A4R3ME58_9HYPH|nr:diaminopimelate epimerase [Tepidamorphus gemmatus]